MWNPWKIWLGQIRAKRVREVASGCSHGGGQGIIPIPRNLQYASTSHSYVALRTRPNKATRDFAVEKRILVLHAHKLSPAMLVGHLIEMGKLPAPHRARADVHTLLFSTRSCKAFIISSAGTSWSYRVRLRYVVSKRANEASTALKMAGRQSSLLLAQIMQHDLKL